MSFNIRLLVLVMFLPIFIFASSKSVNSCENPYATYSIGENSQNVYENNDYNKKDQDIYIYFTTQANGKLDLKIFKHGILPMKHQLFIGTSCDNLTLVERTSYEFSHNVDDLEVIQGQQYIIKLVKRSKGYSRYSISFNLSKDEEPKPIVATSLNLSSNVTTLTTGDTTTLSVTANYSDGTTKNVTNDVSFTLSNTQVATISG